jgi:hypothetical protein
MIIFNPYAYLSFIANLTETIKVSKQLKCMNINAHAVNTVVVAEVAYTAKQHVTSLEMCSYSDCVQHSVYY